MQEMFHKKSLSATVEWKKYQNSDLWNEYTGNILNVTFIQHFLNNLTKCVFNTFSKILQTAIQHQDWLRLKTDRNKRRFCSTIL